MDRRIFIQSAGVVGVALLAGCTGGGTFIPSGGSTTLQAPVPTTATLIINFNAPVAQKSVIPEGTETLILRGYDAEGSVVYGPTQVPPPASDSLLIEVPVTMTTFEIAGIATPVLL